MKLRPLILPIVLLAVVAAPAALPKERATKPADPVKLAAPTAPAHLRLWKADLPDVPEVRLVWREAASSPGKSRSAAKPREVARAGAGFQFGEYAEVPAGRGSLRVEAEARRFDDQIADLAPGSFYTALVTAAGMELIADGPPAAAGTGDFTLRTLAPGVRVTSLRVGEEIVARFGPAEGFLRLRGLRAGVHAVRTEGTDAEGKPFAWTAEADFNRAPRQTLLVYPDSYGRIRPRLTVDGAADAGDAGKPENP